ncbi:sugar phosphate isomerase/epimerase family protein [Roseivirga pacifica]
MKRRAFIKNGMLATGAAMTLGLEACSTSEIKATPYGLGLFSIPKMLDTDIRAGFKMLAEMGYKEVELYGPFPFSVQSVKDSWAAVTPQLGFSGSGFFGNDVKTFASTLKEFGLKATSTHADIETLQTRMPQMAEAAYELGMECVGIPSIPPELRTSLDDYKRMADVFNEVGANAKKEGLKFIYHNHGYGLHEMEGEIPVNLILENTDPDTVFLEMDIFWTVAGGADPVAYLKNNPGRYVAMHLKDMKEKKQFSGDGGDPSQWIELFPYMTTAGDGVLDLKSIVSEGAKNGVKHFFIEQDMVANPEVALKRSIDHLKAIHP